MSRPACFLAGVWESEAMRMLNTENVGIQCWKVFDIIGRLESFLECWDSKM